MKKQLFNVLVVMMTAAPAIAIPNPYLSGEVKLQGHVITFRDRVVCGGASAMSPTDPTKRTDPKDVVWIVWNLGFAPEGDATLMGDAKLDGNLVTVQGNLKDGSINISVQAPVAVAGTVSAFAASTSGILAEGKSVSLDYRYENKNGFINCEFKK